MKEVAKGTMPGFAYLIGRGDRILEYGSGGYKAIIPRKEPAEDSTIYDLASITKPLVTATLILLLQEKKALNINDYIEEYLPKLRELSAKRIRIKDLMSHCGGIKSWYPLFIFGKSLEEYIDIISRMKTEYKACEAAKYSCVGYIILAAIIEEVAKKNIKELYRVWIIEALGLKDTFFHSNKKVIHRIAATEKGSKTEMDIVRTANLKFNKWRKYLIRGEVHDSNAYFANSRTGNAGLFSTIFDLFKIARIYFEDGVVLKRESLNLFYYNNTPYSDGHWSLGWKLGSTKGTAAELISKRTLCHGGFTGTAIWIEPFKRKTYILLTNRIHPKALETNINKVRMKFVELAERIYG